MSTTKNFGALTNLNVAFKKAVSQSGAITSGVTLNGEAGTITTTTANTATSGTSAFTVTNSFVSGGHKIFAAISDYDGAGLPGLFVKNITQGSFQVVISNAHPTAALNASLDIFFAVI